MKRFITYLYEYERGQKTQNNGFVRVDERQGRVNMQICIRQYIRTRDTGKIYALAQGETEALQGWQLGELVVSNGQGDCVISELEQRLSQGEHAPEDVVGIAVLFEGGGYLASCWKDEYMERIARRSIILENTTEEVDTENKFVEGESEESPELQFQTEKCQEENSETEQSQELELGMLQVSELTPVCTYRKIELNEIRSLPSGNWYLCQNRFLVHGFYNYGYLILETQTTDDAAQMYLGVPGIFEKPEMVMATLFGFELFHPLPEQLQTSETYEALKDMSLSLEKPAVGTYGCWCIPVRK